MIPLSIYLWPTALGGSTDFLLVQGQSMLPNILPGSFVITKLESSYEVGDVVSFAMEQGSAKKIVVHRIIDENENGFIMQGDNNPTRDAGVYPTEKILGKLVVAIPYLGDLLGTLRNPVMLVVIAFIMAIIQMEQKRRRQKKEKLRRIQLGITKQQEIEKSGKTPQKKLKKPDFTLFYAALFFDILIYILMHVGLASGIRVQGDALTGFLFTIFEPSFASTVAFAIYFFMIMGIFFMAKVYGIKIETAKKSEKGVQMKMIKKSNTIFTVAQLLWLMYILLGLFHLLALGADIMPILT